MQRIGFVEGFDVKLRDDCLNEGLAREGRPIPEGFCGGDDRGMTLTGHIFPGAGCYTQQMLKFPSERCAGAPEYLSAPASMGPKVPHSAGVGILATGGAPEARVRTTARCSPLLRGLQAHTRPQQEPHLPLPMPCA